MLAPSSPKKLIGYNHFGFELKAMMLLRWDMFVEKQLKIGWAGRNTGSEELKYFEGLIGSLGVSNNAKSLDKARSDK